MRSSTARYHQRTCLLAAATLALASLARAQTLKGRVVAKEDGVPIAGAIVALLDSTGRAITTGLAEDGGTFSFIAPAAGRYRVRVERVGFRSTTSNAILVGQDETIDVPMSIASENVSLRAVHVSADRRCLVRPQEGLATAQLWNEARKALNATQLTQLAQAATKSRRNPHRFAVRWRKFKRELEPRLLTTIHDETAELEGEAVTPFVSADPERLARDGYVAGDLDTGSTFFAPDAAILLSDRFLDAHCFRLQEPEQGRRDDLIGLAFEPVGLTGNWQSKRVEVRGVLWLDRASAELRYLEYGYVNLPFRADASRAGGRLEFRPLPDGRWIVWRWYIRTPRLQRQRPIVSAQVGDWQTDIVRINEDGAELLAVMPAGSTRATPGAMRGIVFDSLRGGPMPGVRVFLSGTTHASITDAQGRYAIESVPAGHYLASIVTPRIDTLLIEPPSHEFSMSAGEDKEVNFALPSLRSMSTTICREPATDSSIVVVGIVRDTDATKALGATIRAEWLQVAGQGTSDLRMRTISLETTVGTAGRYAICNLPPAVRFTLRARQGRNVISSAQLPARAGEVRRVDLSLRAP